MEFGSGDAAVDGQVPVVLVYEKLGASADLVNCWKRPVSEQH